MIIYENRYLKLKHIYFTDTFFHTRQDDSKKIVYFQNIYYSVTRHHMDIKSPNCTDKINFFFTELALEIRIHFHHQGAPVTD